MIESINKELPKNIPRGESPRSVTVVVEGDLVERCNLNDRVYVSTQFLSLLSEGGGVKNVVMSNNVYPIPQESNAKSTKIKKKESDNM